ncbi:precorrin-6y C5,15-methyltransferase (decarboxylating) subunit CbiE [Streptomyces sp. M600PL45_2]|uniref:Precorrin-6y C5,15-methyltransferase (Decarboxylating) subunit CbiE n=2 Tax=Streptomyces marispadix TaxID=2922868 RepID=A0ABS9STJ8_9ACTN|nr:precorrin-6y C5,15-methyltransferase (decarboxylating) subunit CbiE [Streptomyces marispadix]MCH6159596.1 precorrin-6y C5,15-methyltransferase (decarboxylating) subunit CbiE [Streptomyces marispadix]
MGTGTSTGAGSAGAVPAAHGEDRSRARALAEATLVVGARRHLDAAPLPPGAERIVLGPLAPALDAIAAHLGGARSHSGTGEDAPARVVVLASGDPGFFGIVRALAERFGASALRVLPSVPSVGLAFARAGLSWDDAAVVSAHGRDPRTAVNLCRSHPKTAVLTGPACGPAELGAALAGTGIPRTLVVATSLGTEDERVERLSPAEAAARAWPDPVSVVLCLDPARTVPSAQRALAGGRTPRSRWALPEEEFAHRDSMVTKYEVRALALARLAPGPGDLIWDVGAGSGSVAVECALLGAAAVAVEQAADGVERVRANAAAHGVDLQTVHGGAPGVLDGLPDPDAVFVGGGGRDLAGIVAACAARARRSVVVTLAALDRVPEVRAALSGAGLVTDGVLLNSSRLSPLPGDVMRLAATNPVFVLWGTVPHAGPATAESTHGSAPGGNPGSTPANTPENNDTSEGAAP